MFACSDRVWPWVADCAMMLYVARVAHVLSVRVPMFGLIFTDFGAEVPAITSLTIKACTPPIPYIVAACIGIALALKNRTRASAVAKLGMSVVVLVLVVAGMSSILEALFRPLLDLIEKLSGNRA